MNLQIDSSNNKMAKKNNGTGLENTVFQIYGDLRHLGYFDLKQNIHLSKKNGYPIHAQIDLMYNYYGGPTVYVECKSRKDTISLADISNFFQILDLLNVPKLYFPYRGEIVTDNYFSSRVIQAAQKENVRLIDRNELQRLESLRKSGIGPLMMMYSAVDKFKAAGISGVLEYALPRMTSLDKQLKINMK